ncbi:hypothetical protein [Candidatus Finniella inopinata]|uniref:Uncharacterized protein n=1 Tax=Candidatus Finniella inopinata TaxID=1696036 RepID=A0A4Q7DJR1_9PROT|nr:hypothetical protein [Candidatus Finniella inopinata]RZI47113.1 hypothetical protein EQU50_00585 [Candidatus Finniella inopinata]
MLDDKSFGSLVPTFNRCSLEDKGNEGFLPLMLKEKTVYLYQGNWSLGKFFPWSRVPSFIRKYFNVMDIKAGENIPWRHFEQFLTQYSEIRYLWPKAHHPSIKDKALKEIESFLEQGRVTV